MKAATFAVAGVLAFAVYAVIFGVTFFCIGGFLLVHAGRAVLFLAIVFVPAAFMALLTAILAISPRGLPGSMGDVS
jgi:hypothetical protein